MKIAKYIAYDLSTVDYHGDCALRDDSLEQLGG